jgi:hypothetical protein
MVSFLLHFSLIYASDSVGTAEETSKDHADKAPHNGQILDTGEKHVEFLVKGGKEVFVYFYDKNLKPISVEGTEGTVYFKLADNSKKELNYPLSETTIQPISKEALPLEQQITRKRLLV